MDPVIEAQLRLEQAVSRLEEALARSGGDPADHGRLAEIEDEVRRMRAQNAEFQALKSRATERLDAAIRQVKTLIDN